MTSCPARLEPDLARDPDSAAAAPVIRAVRERAPLVHYITATVSMGIVVDGLLAASARPMMTETLAEAPVVTTVAEALAVNLGTLGTDAMEGIPAAVAAARELLGPDAVIGLTIGTLELVRAAEELRGVIDYVGAGPFRLAPTKDSGRSPLGVARYPGLVAATELPIVAIRDVTPADAAALAGTGVAGVALVQALMAAEDPGEAPARNPSTPEESLHTV